MKLIPSSQSVPQKIQSIMQQLAFDGCMREVQNYGFFDNEFLRQIGWKVTNGLKVANPIAEQVDTMVTSLVPRLLKNVETNSANHDNLRFFEWAKTWDLKKKDITEIHTLSGVMFNKKKIDFYEEKAVLNRLFEMMGLDVAWKPRAKKIVWAHKYQSSDLYCGKTYIGTAGIVTLPMMAAVAKGEAFAFELNGTALIELQPKEQRFAGMPKYQATTLDVSVMVPLSETVAELAKTIINSDERIFDVSLVDIFKKDDWEDKKSVTMRFSLRDEEKTLSKDEIDACYQSVEKSLSKLGAEVR
jgi:phenylalanyl-tRNA synthetase beta chain